MSIDEAYDDLEARGTDMIVISGGEPFLQQAALEPLVNRGRRNGWWIEVETAGTIAPSEAMAADVCRFNVSPKLANSGNAYESRCQPAALASLNATGKAIWKFVVREPNELDEVQTFVDQFRLSPIYIMPEGITTPDIADRLQSLAQPVLDRGWNLTSRLHVLLYGNKRGV